MPPNIDHDAMWRTGIAFWCGIWQAQMETSLRLWAAWAQALPHENARALADEAEAMKPPARRVPANRTRPQSASAHKTARKPAASG